jgi:hypothetical protein
VSTGNFSRRNLLRGAAGLTLALPWLESLAQAGALPPRRVIFCFTANGDQVARRMKVKSETGFVFDDMLDPFEAWRQNVLVLDGVHKNHHLLPAGQQADAHQQGGSALAPWPSGSGSFPIGGTSSTIGYVEGPSADRVIGDRVLQSTAVPYRHLVYRVGDKHNNIWNQHAHAGPVGTQAPIPPETDPFAAYTRIFGNLNTAQTDALKRRLKLRQSSLDLLTGELASLKPKLASADRTRLEQHTESILEIERGLTALEDQVPECKPLNLGSSFDVYNPDNYQQVGFLFFKISAMAFACDLTRSIQFNWSGNTSDRVYKPLGLTQGHHTISHDSSEAAFVKIRAIKRHLFDLSCQLHTELKAIPEAGKTVWDNTLVVHWSELSQGDTHARNNDLVVLASGSNYFRMGRYLNIATASRRSFSDLLVSCFHFMGFSDVNTFGYEPLGGGGPLPNLV